MRGYLFSSFFFYLEPFPFVWELRPLSDSWETEVLSCAIFEVRTGFFFFNEMAEAWAKPSRRRPMMGRVPCFCNIKNVMQLNLMGWNLKQDK